MKNFKPVVFTAAATAFCIVSTSLRAGPEVEVIELEKFEVNETQFLDPTLFIVVSDGGTTYGVEYPAGSGVGSTSSGGGGGGNGSGAGATTAGNTTDPGCLQVQKAAILRGAGTDGKGIQYDFHFAPGATGVFVQTFNIIYYYFDGTTHTAAFTEAMPIIDGKPQNSGGVEYPSFSDANAMALEPSPATGSGCISAAVWINATFIPGPAVAPDGYNPSIALSSNGHNFVVGHPIDGGFYHKDDHADYTLLESANTPIVSRGYIVDRFSDEPVAEWMHVSKGNCP